MSLPDNVHIAKLIIDNGANVNIATKTGTPLHSAVRSSSGIFVPFRTFKKFRPLLRPFNRILDNEKVIEILLKNGANASIVDADKKTPLHVAVTYGDFQYLT